MWHLPILQRLNRIFNEIGSDTFQQFDDKRWLNTGLCTTSPVGKEEMKMNRLEFAEKIRNLFDIGYMKETLRNFIRAHFEMGAKEFFKHLLFGSGYAEVTPPQLERLLSGDSAPPVIDLRQEENYRKSHITGARSHPFDDFLKSAVMDGGYADLTDKQLVLVCDTGHQSRVAASILADLGFRHIASLNRGMRRFSRWQRLKSVYEVSKGKVCGFCNALLA